MPNSDPSTGLLRSLFQQKCPRCRAGEVFVNKHILPLKECLDVVDYCGKCGQKIKVENNYGQGMNFVFIIAVFIIDLLWYWPIFGLSWKDNSIFYYLGVSVVLSLLLQPFLMRLSRILFLYLVVPFNRGGA